MVGLKFSLNLKICVCFEGWGATAVARWPPQVNANFLITIDCFPGRFRCCLIIVQV